MTVKNKTPGRAGTRRRGETKSGWGAKNSAPARYHKFEPRQGDLFAWGATRPLIQFSTFTEEATPAIRRVMQQTGYSVPLARAVAEIAGLGPQEAR